MKWPYDFDLYSKIKKTRVPSSKAPVAWANGNLYVFVCGGYYALVGDCRVPWIVDVAHVRCSP